MSSLFPPPQNNSLVWQPESRTRGSFNILSTCLITLISCVWSAVHLNLPEHEEPDKPDQDLPFPRRVGRWFRIRKYFWRKCAWVLLGLLTPEMITYASWVQRVQAHQLYRDVAKELYGRLSKPWHVSFYRRDPGGSSVRLEKEKRPDLRSTPPVSPLFTDGISILKPFQYPDEKKKPLSGIRRLSDTRLQPQFQEKDDLDWQSIHAYYGTMGGFAFDIDTEAGLPFEGRFTITPAGLRFLATYAPELIPRITPAEIEDKSKADGFAKFLVCIQASWFCLQCVTRMAQRLSISLLELNTFAHALCALFTYTRWWEKPLSIREPSLVRSELGDDGANEIWALLYLAMIANVGQEGANQGHGFARNSMPESTRVYLSWANPNSYETSSSIVPRETPDCEPHPQAFSTIVSASRLPDLGLCPLLPKFSIYSRNTPPSAFLPRTPNFDEEKSEVKKVFKVKEKLHGFTLVWVAGKFEGTEATYIHLTAAKIRCLELASRALERCEAGKGLDAFYEIARYPCIASRVKNWPSSSDEAFKDFGGFNWQLLAFGIASAFFGGLHLIAWHAYFPSPTEILLWKVSAFTITALGPALVVGNALALIVLPQWKTPESTKAKDKGLKILIALPSIFYAALYSFARVYIIVACYINLVHLSDAAFQVPAWSKYFPHVS